MLACRADECTSKLSAVHLHLSRKLELRKQRISNERQCTRIEEIQDSCSFVFFREYKVNFNEGTLKRELQLLEFTL